MKMKLNCMMIGVAGSAFPVVIDENELISQLKDAIKKENEKMIKCDAYDLKLYLAKMGHTWLKDDDDAIKQLKKGIITGDIDKMCKRENEIESTNTLQRWIYGLCKMPEPATKEIHVLVQLPPQVFASYRPHPEGLNVQLPHLPRDALVQKLHYGILSNKFVLVAASSASGKTSLLNLFAHQYPEIFSVSVAFYDSKADPMDLLAYRGINIAQKTCRILDDKLCVFMLEGCQRHYQNIGFWTALIEDSPSWLPQHVRFIISVTRLPEVNVSASSVVAAFSSIPLKLTRNDFLLKEQEVYQFFNLENGLSANMRFATLMEVIKKECNGHIGSLRQSVDVLYVHFHHCNPSEQDLLVYYLSNHFLEHMSRCFGNWRSLRGGQNIQTCLTKCWFRASGRFDDDDKDCLTQLMNLGIVIDKGDGFVKFASPLAERYYSKWLFSNRGHKNPSSLYDLIRKVIGNMSASALKQSINDRNDFPNRATFQHQFMEGLARHTYPMCSICPNLSRVFPDSPSDRDQRIDEEIDFYLGGSLHWGIELLVNGDQIGEHVFRFAPGGKYAALAVREYAIIDLRGNESGGITNVVRKPERITVFFKMGDFSSCHCIFGLAEDYEEINLKKH